MADWTAPFHLPRITDETYYKRKAAYVAKHGYAITIPDWTDIIHITAEEPLTPEEAQHYVAKDYKWFSPSRLQQIRTMKQRRRRHLETMLASPSPAMAQNLASIMTAIDDAEDALSTLMVIMRCIVAEFPSLAVKYVTLPFAWIMGVTTVFDTTLALTRPGISAMVLKDQLERIHKHNPFTKKGRLKAAKNMKQFHGSTGAVIEALQTTDQIFGIGVSLGPIMGFANDILYGITQTILGHKVRIRTAVPIMGKWEKAAFKFLKSQALFFWNNQGWTQEDNLRSSVAGLYSAQAMHAYTRVWNPLTQIIDPQGVMIPAPQLTNPISIEAFTDIGLDPKNHIGWPIFNKPSVPAVELLEAYTAYNQYAARETIQLSQNDPTVLVSGANMSNQALYTIDAAEGPGMTDSEYAAEVTLMMGILEQGAQIKPPPWPPKHRETFYNPPDFYNWAAAKEMNVKDALRYMNSQYTEDIVY
jgi:hypothetical protein